VLLAALTRLFRTAARVAPALAAAGVKKTKAATAVLTHAQITAALLNANAADGGGGAASGDVSAARAVARLVGRFNLAHYPWLK
jgi:hypothetical protein